jgi:hypothetical protein
MIEAGPGIYKVQSDSSNKEYIVDLTGAVHSCTCTAWAIARNRAVAKGNPAPACKHIRYVISQGGTAVPTVNKPAANKTANELAALLAELSDEPAPKPEPQAEIVKEILKPDFDAARLLNVESTPVEAPVEAPPTPVHMVTVSADDLRTVLDLVVMVPDNSEELEDAVTRLTSAIRPVTDSPSAEHPVCPRCSGFIPSNERPGEYPGALSRADNKTEICSACGTDEGMEQFLDGAPTPVSAWPIQSRKYEFPEAKV